MKTRNFFPIVITVILVAILLSQIELIYVFKAVKNISPIWLIIGFILYNFCYFFRALRFHILLDRKISIKDLFFIVSLHNMTNSLLPARTGELSYIYLVKKSGDISTTKGVATLAIARVLDFVTITIIFIVSIFFIFRELPLSLAQFPVLLIIAMLFVILTLYLISRRGDTIKVIENIASKIGVQRSRLFSSLIEKGKELQKEYDQCIFLINSSISSAFFWCVLFGGNNE